MKIYILRKTFQKIKYYVKNCNQEIAGLGKITAIDNGAFIIYNAELIEQDVSAGHADFDEFAMSRFLTTKIREGESPVDYKVWWHSHANMHAYFSPRDINTINKSTEFPYLISLVINKTYEYNCRLDIYDPIRMTLTDIELVEIDDEDPELEKQCQQDILKYVKRSIFDGKKKSSILLNTRKK